MQRILAFNLLRDAAIEANARGDIALVRRMSSVVIEDIKRGKASQLENSFWAAAFAIHWANSEYDLITVERMLESQADEANHQSLKLMELAMRRLPLKWQLLGMTTQVLLLRREIKLTELTSIIQRRMEFGPAPLEPDEQVDSRLPRAVVCTVTANWLASS